MVCNGSIYNSSLVLEVYVCMQGSTQEQLYHLKARLRR